jgi:hypothetical protein
MSRPKLISDAAILTIVRERLLRGGDKAVSFREVANATGLSAPALVLRFSTHGTMVSAALQTGWYDLAKLAKTAAADMGRSPKDVQEFFKLQADLLDIPALLAHSMREDGARSAASSYRSVVEAILADHFGGGIAGRNTAGLLFAAWMGRMALSEAGGKTFRFGELIRSVT